MLTLSLFSFISAVIEVITKLSSISINVINTKARKSVSTEYFQIINFGDAFQDPKVLNERKVLPSPLLEIV